MHIFNKSVMHENVTETELYSGDSFTSIIPSYTGEHVFVDDVDIPSRHRTIVAVIWCVVAVIGLFGNTLVVTSVIIAKKLQTTTNILVVNLAIADFLTCLCLPVQSFMLLADEDRKSSLPDIICAIVGGTTYTCILCSISTLVAIAFLRWYVITKSIRGHRGIHTPRKMLMVVVIIWVESLLVTFVPSFLGIVEFGQSRFYSLCSITDFNPRRVYYILLQGLILLVSLIVIGVLYSLILVHVVRHYRDLRGRMPSLNNPSNREESSHTVINTISSTATNPTTATTATTVTNATNAIIAATPSRSRTSVSRDIIRRREVAITKNLFAVVCVFALCYLPTGVNLVIPGANVFTLYSMMIGLANNAVNPIIYGLKHPIFQDVFKRILLCKFSGLSESCKYR